MNLMPPIKIGIHLYDVVADEESWARLCRNDAEAAGGKLLGRTEHMNAVIYLNPEQPDAMRRDTLLHECIHCIVFACIGGDVMLGAMAEMGAEDAQEYLCCTLAPWLALLIADNPHLTEYLKG